MVSVSVTMMRIVVEVTFPKGIRWKGRGNREGADRGRECCRGERRREKAARKSKDDRGSEKRR